MKAAKRISRPFQEWRKDDWVVGKIVGTNRGYFKTKFFLKIKEVKWKYRHHPEKLRNKILEIDTAYGTARVLENVRRGPVYGDLIQIKYLGVQTIEDGVYKGKTLHRVGVDQVEEVGRNQS